MNNSTITHVLALCLTMIVAAEQNLPQSGLGGTKKQLVLNGVQAALGAASAVSTATGHNDVAGYTSLASTFIDQTIATLNKNGVFKQAAAK